MVLIVQKIVNKKRGVGQTLKKSKPNMEVFHNPALVFDNRKLATEIPVQVGGIGTISMQEVATLLPFGLTEEQPLVIPCRMLNDGNDMIRGRIQSNYQEPDYDQDPTAHPSPVVRDGRSYVNEGMTSYFNV